jgi:hypothetical protein
MISVTAHATAVDEAALILAIRDAAIAAGWTTWGPTGTTPAGSVWFLSPGRDGCSRICGGLLSTTVGRMRAAVAADIDAFSVVSANVGGYVNNDSAGVGNPVQSITPDTTTAWETKTAGSYEYILAITPDSIAVLTSYTATTSAQGVLYIGKTQPSSGRLFQTQAKGLIESVSGSTIRLDRDITAMLKSPVSGDIVTQQSLMFQAFATSLADAPDFAMVQRIPIVAGSLSTVDGATEFDLLLTGTKLDAVSGRYDDGRGAGDSVRLMSETNIALCGGDNGLSATLFSSTSNTALAAWDAVGGQATALDVILSNTVADQITNVNPIDFINRYVPYEIYALNVDTNTGLIAQPDTNGAKNVGALIGIGMLPNNTSLDFRRYRRDGDLLRRYRILSRTDINAPSGFADQDTVWAIGPGW